jgi:hypothetical protein
VQRGESEQRGTDKQGDGETKIHGEKQVGEVAVEDKNARGATGASVRV